VPGCSDVGEAIGNPQHGVGRVGLLIEVHDADNRDFHIFGELATRTSAPHGPANNFFSVSPDTPARHGGAHVRSALR
jgi:hypothetical protein